jgi:hypothetical protein
MNGPIVDLVPLDLMGSCSGAPSEALRKQNIVQINGTPILVRFGVSASPVRDEGDFEHHE